MKGPIKMHYFTVPTLRNTTFRTSPAEGPPPTFTSSSASPSTPETATSVPYAMVMKNVCRRGYSKGVRRAQRKVRALDPFERRRRRRLVVQRQPIGRPVVAEIVEQQENVTAARLPETSHFRSSVNSCSCFRWPVLCLSRRQASAVRSTAE